MTTIEITWCAGTTKQGEPCQRRVGRGLVDDAYCHVHQNQSPLWSPELERLVANRAAASRGRWLIHHTVRLLERHQMRKTAELWSELLYVSDPMDSKMHTMARLAGALHADLERRP